MESILISSVLCSVGHTIPLFFMFSLATSVVASLVMINGIGLVQNRLTREGDFQGKCPQNAHPMNLCTLKTKILICVTLLIVETTGRGDTNSLLEGNV